MSVDLTTLTDALNDLLADEDLTDEKLRDAAEGLLPTLADALRAAGHGTPGTEPSR